jgi:hypothetical protein
VSTKTKPENGTPSQPDVTPASVWRERAVHTVTGFSGSTCKIRIVGIPKMLELGVFPDYLLRIALLDISKREGAVGVLAEALEGVLDSEKRAELIQDVVKLAEYERRIVAASLVEPALTYEEIDSGDFPEDDFSMILEIVQRRRSFDARGVRIGVEPLDRWAMFHREHGLDPEDCQHCKRLSGELSSVDVGAV